MNEVEYTVEQVPVERTRALRKAVLRPYLPDDDPYALADDQLPSTVAFGAVASDGELIGVVRVAPEPPPFDPSNQRGWRLRGMATSPSARNLGVGTALLRATVDHVATTGGGTLWCNARVSARGLYQRGGMQQWGGVWDEPHIGPHIVMWRNID